MNRKPEFESRLRAVLALLCGRSEGLSAFADTPQAVRAGLRPFVWMVGLLCGFLLLHGQILAALLMLMFMTSSILAPLVVSHALAERLRIAAGWYRYAAAFLWCQWGLTVLLLVVMFVLSLGMVGAMGEQALENEMLLAGRLAEAMQFLALIAFGYMVWLQWFLARHALGANGSQAVLLAVGTSAGAGAIMTLPTLGGYL